MKRTIIVPDVHGRAFFEKVLEERFAEDDIIFLGDYVDPYRYEDEFKGKDRFRLAIDRLKKILEFKRQNMERVTLLLGNHDLGYIIPGYEVCRRDIANFKELTELFRGNSELFQVATHRQGYLLTHAGVVDQFYDRFLKGNGCDGSLDNICDILNNKLPLKYHRMASWFRGGDDPYSSPMWADIDEFDRAQPLDHPQIFGHSQIEMTGDIVFFKEQPSMYHRSDGSMCCDSRAVFELKDRKLIPIFV